MSSGRDEMMENWSEEARMKQIESVSAELDDYFVVLANKYELSVSALNGVLMARLLRLNVEVGNEDNLYKLLEVVLQKDHESWSIH
jgi:GTPase SAR1 family protein